jgi:hypothetical protein
VGVGQKDDLHTENHDEGGECYRGITRCLASSVSFNRLGKHNRHCSLINLDIRIGYEAVDVNNDILSWKPVPRKLT